VGALVALARGAGIEPVWLTQPALYGDARDVTTGVDLARVKVNGRGNGLLEWQLLELHNDVVRALARADNVQVIDLARELPKDSRENRAEYLEIFLAAARVGAIVASHLAPYLRAKYGR